jgi:hypothetical protein
MKFLRPTLALLSLLAFTSVVGAAEKKPNIVVIWGDDIGQFNISAYNHGMMGYKTPNIDSPKKAPFSPTGMANKAAPPAAPPSSPANRPSAPG